MEWDGVFNEFVSRGVSLQSTSCEESGERLRTASAGQQQLRRQVPKAWEFINSLHIWAQGLMTVRSDSNQNQF